ncbi:aminotransferase class V-fold PLP-dependent enzyme [Siccirubricoccus sp. KC 17139]|uniref:Cysteine desulfurase n=1 Tax=Siccirubricoccus soli TaxID=2899147 RepID=A0ABT1D6U0_9PROT|nr:aminotransferase class V-fold PLP-dependent enzyme [Siccirubricoccus soli]MCO6417641.1 aminotransferase class V-fold PLP-dependent enzyme [Siccirubricoccus soli]MCP2683776.1 aminotransferase class V-fold PLP-dependent enzyme [Siccirubricoccus soli]
MRPNRPIYLDNHATTPVDPRVLAAMRPWWEENFANPHSVEHVLGRAAEAAVEQAREAVAALIGAEAREIILTSGATESNNLAIKGAARFAAQQGGERRRIVTLATEHKCVLESVRDLAAEGFEPVVLPVRPDGLADLDRLRETVDDRTLLVTIMAVNNEIGVVQPLAEIGTIAKAAGALFHTDAAQGAGRIPLDVAELQADLLSLSGHKIYGPKGIGALYVRRRPRVRLAPLFSGGGQERGLRSGTLPAPLIVGLGEAARLAAIEGMLDAGRIAGQRDRFLAALRAEIPEVRLNGDAERRVPGNLNLTFPGIARQGETIWPDAQAIMAAAPDVCVSTGSACSSAEVEPSYVLRALGISEREARATLRIGIGRFTSPADVDQAAAALAAAWRQALAAGARP